MEIKKEVKVKDKRIAKALGVALLLAIFVGIFFVVNAAVNIIGDAVTPAEIPLAIKDSQSKLVKADIKVLQEKGPVKDVQIIPKSGPIKEITIRKANVTEEVRLGIDDVPETGSNARWQEVYAIDPTQLEFDNATVTVQAKGSVLYKCKDWNFEEQSCEGEWKALMDITPGQEYSFTLTAEDPGYGEGESATAADIWVDRSSYAVGGGIIYVDGRNFTANSTVQIDIQNAANTSVVGYPKNITANSEGNITDSWSTPTDQAAGNYTISAIDQSNSSLSDSVTIELILLYNKIKDDAQFDVTIASTDKDANNTLTVIFYHNNSQSQTIHVTGPVSYNLSQSSSVAGENVTLIIYNWTGKYFRLVVGKETLGFKEGIRFGKQKTKDLSTAIKNAAGAEINTTIEFIDSLTDAVEYNVTGKGHSGNIKEGRYKVKVKPIGHVIKQIEFSDVDVYTNLTEIVNIDDVPENISAPVNNWSEVYAIDASQLNFTSAIVTVEAKGKDLFKCTEWNFTTQTCAGRWKKIANIAQGQGYNFTLTPADPAFAEGNNSINILDKDSYLLYANESLLNITGDIVDIDIVPENHTIKKLIVYDHNQTDENNDLVIEDQINLTAAQNETRIQDVFSINPLNLSHTNLTIVLNATANDLFECANWSDTNQICVDEEWTKIKDIVPGQEYNFTIQTKGKGYGVNKKDIALLNKNLKLLRYNEQVLNATGGTKDILIELQATKIKKITVHRFNKTSNKNDISTETNLTTPFSFFQEVYDLDPTGLEFEYAEVTAIAIGNDLFKCLNWNFSTQTCTGDWKQLMDLIPGQEYSFNITAEDPGFGESNSTINILDKDNYVLDYNETILSSVNNISDIEVSFANHTISKIIIYGYNESSTSNDLRIEDKTSVAGFDKAYSVDPTSLSFNNATISLTATNSSNILYKCLDWNFTSQTCYGEWIALQAITPGQNYTFTINATDPGLAESSGLWFEGFESGSLATNNWTTSGAGAAWAIDTFNPYAGIYDISTDPYGAESIIETNVTTVGYKNINFSFYYTTDGLDAGEYIAADWYNGTAWIQVLYLESDLSDTWYIADYVLPAAADNNSDFKIRFRCLADTPNEECYVDNVQISGDAISNLTIALSSDKISPNVTLDINATGITANASTEIDIIFNSSSVSGYPKTLNATASGEVNDSWTAPTNASLGSYTVKITDQVDNISDEAAFQVLEPYTINGTLKDSSNLTISGNISLYRIGSRILEAEEDESYNFTMDYGDEYELEIVINNYAIKNVTIKGLLNVGNLEDVIILETPSSADNLTEIVSWSTSTDDFSTIEVTFNYSAGDDLGLYKCTDWNWSTQSCSGSWRKVADVCDGYCEAGNVTVYGWPGDPGAGVGTDPIYSEPPDYANITDIDDNSTEVTLEVAADDTTYATIDTTEDYANNGTLELNWSNNLPIDVVNSANVTIYWLREFNTGGQQTGDTYADFYWWNVSASSWEAISGCQDAVVPEASTSGIPDDEISSYTCNLTALVDTASEAQNLKLYIEFGTAKQGGAGDTAQVYVDYVVYTLNYTSTDIQAPQFSNRSTYPPHPATYSPTAQYQFNTTWTDNVAVDTVLIEHNFTGNLTNYTVSTAVGDEYYYNWSSLAVDSYVWREYANDSAGNWNATTQWLYTVNKANDTISLYLNGNESNLTITYDTQSNATAISLSGTEQLWRDGVYVTNPEIATLATGSYAYKANSTGNQNYTANETGITYYLTVNKAATVLNLTASPNWTVEYTTETNVSCSANNAEVNLTLWRNSTLIGSSVGGVVSDVANLSVGSYNYTCNNTASQNYTANSTSNLLTVTKYASEISLLLNGTDGNFTINQSEAVNMTAALVTPSSGYIELYKEGVMIANGSSPLTNITVFPDAGAFNITALYPETANYSSSYETHFVIVRDIEAPKWSDLKESPTDPATYSPSETYQFNATWTDNVAVDTVRLEWNGTNYSVSTVIGDEFYYEFADLGAGNYSYRWYANDSEGNWNSTPQQNYTINKAANPVNLYINGNLDQNVTISYSESNATGTSAGGTALLWRDGVAVSNPEITTLSVGSYAYKVNASSDQNYTANSTGLTYWLTVTEEASEINLTLNDVDDNITIYTGESVNITATLITPPEGNIDLYQNGSIIASGGSPLSTTASYPDAGSYNITAIFNGSANYTATYETHWITVLADTEAPVITDYSIVPKAVITGNNVSLNASATDNAVVEELAVNITLPNLTVLSYAVPVNYTTQLVGRHNVTFWAIDQAGNIGNATDYFIVQDGIVFNSTTVDYNGSAINTTLTVYFPGTTEQIDIQNFTGTYSEELPNYYYDLLFSSYNVTLQVLLSSINISAQNNRVLGTDKLEAPIIGYIATYAVNSTYNISSAQVTISYIDVIYSNEDYLGVHSCADWNFSARSCTGNWTDITATTTQDKSADTFTFNVTGFSGFSIKQEAVPVPAAPRKKPPARECDDGTAYGECSAQKPLYCDDGELIDKCTLCGCPAGQECNESTDSCYVPVVPIVPVVETCTDKIKNQDETDVDCGGEVCSPCVAGKSCLVNSDCESNYCEEGVCAIPLIPAPPVILKFRFPTWLIYWILVGILLGILIGRLGPRAVQILVPKKPPKAIEVYLAEVRKKREEREKEKAIEAARRLKALKVREQRREKARLMTEHEKALRERRKQQLKELERQRRQEAARLVAIRRAKAWRRFWRAFGFYKTEKEVDWEERRRKRLEELELHKKEQVEKLRQEKEAGKLRLEEEKRRKALLTARQKELLKEERIKAKLREKEEKKRFKEQRRLEQEKEKEEQERRERLIEALRKRRKEEAAKLIAAQRTRKWHAFLHAFGLYKTEQEKEEEAARKRRLVELKKEKLEEAQRKKERIEQEKIRRKLGELREREKLKQKEEFAHERLLEEKRKRELREKVELEQLKKAEKQAAERRKARKILEKRKEKVELERLKKREITLRAHQKAEAVRIAAIKRVKAWHGFLHTFGMYRTEKEKEEAERKKKALVQLKEHQLKEAERLRREERLTKEKLKEARIKRALEEKAELQRLKQLRLQAKIRRKASERFDQEQLKATEERRKLKSAQLEAQQKDEEARATTARKIKAWHGFLHALGLYKSEQKKLEEQERKSKAAAEKLREEAQKTKIRALKAQEEEEQRLAKERLLEEKRRKKLREKIELEKLRQIRLEAERKRQQAEKLAEERLKEEEEKARLSEEEEREQLRTLKVRHLEEEAQLKAEEAARKKQLEEQEKLRKAQLKEEREKRALREKEEREREQEQLRETKLEAERKRKEAEHLRKIQLKDEEKKAEEEDLLRKIRLREEERRREEAERLRKAQLKEEEKIKKAQEKAERERLREAKQEAERRRKEQERAVEEREQTELTELETAVKEKEESKLRRMEERARELKRKAEDSIDRIKKEEKLRLLEEKQEIDQIKKREEAELAEIEEHEARAKGKEKEELAKIKELEGTTIPILGIPLKKRKINKREMIEKLKEAYGVEKR